MDHTHTHTLTFPFVKSIPFEIIGSEGTKMVVNVKEDCEED